MAFKFKSLGINTDSLDLIPQVLNGRARIAAGTDVVRAGKHSTLLLEGTACSYKRSEHGRRSILSFYHAGDFCDLYRYVLPKPDSAVGVQVQALTDVEVAVIDHSDMERILTQPELALAFWRVVMLEASIYRERANTSRGSAIECVAHLLCEQLARREAAGINCARLPLSQNDVADAIGFSVVHVNRAIQYLRLRNLLCKESSSLEVTDRRQLEQVANFDGRYLDMRRLLSNWAVRVE